MPKVLPGLHNTAAPGCPQLAAGTSQRFPKVYPPPQHLLSRPPRALVNLHFICIPPQEQSIGLGTQCCLSIQTRQRLLVLLRGTEPPRA